MSDELGLGEADAEARWIGVRRHQALLVVDWFRSRERLDHECALPPSASSLPASSSW